MQSRPWPQVPGLTAQVARAVTARGPYPLAMRVRDELGELFPDTGMRRARYRGLPKTHLEHAFSAVALNLVRLDAWWSGHPLDRTRTGHLARLDLSLVA
ncbi:hypothetical protein GCM10010207_75170 [Streptomyces atratus]|uniref:transposase n=2 Tax=Streptomyces atratus TaxID=1893 RepID=UPI001670FDFA|nr:transposase [Streptomyces atratus]GGT64954.1 hypothetical protein GCM10010207_75170 [Streptomyces atratus]